MGAAGLNRKRGRPRRTQGLPLGPMAGEPPSAAIGPPDDLAAAKARIAELERVVGRRQLDLDFFQEALRSWDAASRSGDAPISSASSKK